MIEPSRGWKSVRLREFWDHRELLYFFVWRDVKVRYKQSVVGVLWAVIQPLALMALFTAIFSILVHIPHGETAYPVFVFSGLVIWMLFASGLNQSSNSIVMNQQLVSKIYLPRILIPTASVFSGLIDTGVSFLVLVGFMFYFGIVPGVAILTLPLWIMLALGTALGVGLLLSALNVKYRDVQATIPFLTQLWFFSTPIVYSVSLVPPSWRPLMGINPMAGAVDGVRWALFPNNSLSFGLVLSSVGVSLVLLAVGLLYFRRAERTFEDVM